MRLEREKHLAAERRVRDNILGGGGYYPGKDEDLRLIRRKRRERREVRVGGEGGRR